MAIDRFTKEQFEQALPDGFELIETDSEYVYARVVDGTNKRIVVRSSVSPRDDLAKNTGDDSIRIWVEYRYRNTWYSLGKDDVRWTARTKNWRSNMLKRLRDSWKLAIADSNKRKARQTEATKSNAKDDEKVTAKTNDDLNLFAAAAAADAEPVVEPVAPNCRKCGDQMVERSNRRTGEKFWGCSNYFSTPRCNGTRPMKSTSVGGNADQLKAVKKNTFPPSPLQLAIYDFVENGSGHGIVDAKAGTGKTTTNVGAIERIDSSLSVIAMAFNKHIAREQAQLVPDNTKATTCHSQGFSNFRDRYPKARFDGRKFWRHFRTYKQNLTIDAEFVAVDDNAGAIAKLVSLCKGSLLEPTNENLNGICDHFGVNLLNDSFGTTAYVFDAVRSILKSTVADVDTLDYDDMVYFSAAGLVPCEKFDVVVIDECQDLNQGQIQMVFNSLKDGGRILATGDAYQSMYGFRGADAQAVQNIIDKMTAEAGAPPTVLPLDVTYRCPTSVVDLVNKRFPHISFKAAPNAKTGTIAEIGYDALFETAKSDDLVLCRTNAPLVEVCYALIRRGKKAAIRGRDIGKGLIDLLAKVQKRAAVYALADVLQELVDYGDNEVSKLVKAKKFSRAAQIQDQVATIIAVSDGCFTVQDVKTRIDDIFTDDEIGIVCSSIHRAKGDESDTVFIIEPHLMPHPMAEQRWELIQESNVEYVCLTRTRDRLFFVV